MSSIRQSRLHHQKLVCVLMCFSFGVKEKVNNHMLSENKRPPGTRASRGLHCQQEYRAFFLLILEFYILNGVGSKSKRLPNPGKSTKWAHCGPVLGG